MFSFPVETTPPTHGHTVMTMLLVQLARFFANLANGLFYVSMHGRSGALMPGEIFYHLGVTTVDIVVVLYRIPCVTEKGR